MGGTVVIELGELRQSAQPADPPRPPAGRRAPALLIAAALVGALGGAAPAPAPVDPVLIPTAAGDARVLAGDRYYVFAPGAARSGAGVLSTYQLPGGRLVSRTPTTIAGQLIGAERLGGLLLANHAVEGQAEPGSRVTAIDAGTGQIRWTEPGAPVGLSPSGRSVVLANYGRDDGTRWAAVDVATGQRRWTFGADFRDITTFPEEGRRVPRLVTVRTSGLVEVRDTETGAVTAAATLPRPTIIPDGGATVWTSNGLLLIGTAAGLDGYGLDRLDLRWRNPTINPADGFVNPGCGDVICIDAPTGMRAIDPATGQVRWSSEQRSPYRGIGRYLLAGHLDGSPKNEPHTVIDVVTGRQRGTFGRWQPLGEQRRGGSVIGLSRPPGGDVWYALLDPAAMSVRVLGVASGAYGECEVGSVALVCQRSDGTAGVWPLPPG
ncbi:MAG TPA: PQQ-binding-like beta-propeller repeat protein [Catenuloplanes sp.]